MTTAYAKYPGQRTDLCDISVAWAAVAAADRINQGQYYNTNSYGMPADARFNKAIAYDLVQTPELLTDSDRELAVKLSEHFQGLLFRQLSGPITNGFLSTVADIVCKPQVSRFDIACMSALVKTYRQDTERENQQNRAQAFSSTSEYIGLVGTKKTITVQIMDLVYSKKYNINIVTCTDGANLIKFCTAHPAEQYLQNSTVTVSGKIKSCAEDDRTGARVTWLTRVKKIENEQTN